LNDALATCDSICRYPKRHFKRMRPFIRFHESTLRPEFDAELGAFRSFPSGHTTLGWSSALLLMEINPECADTILARGLMYGESRVILGAHWQSDVNAGRLGATAAYARLHSSERFQEQMRLARLEFRCKKGIATAAEQKTYKKILKKRNKK
jgi:acid phosphatase (class A)